MARQKDPDDQTICRNRRATFRYQILEKIECGISLQGTEVKSLRARSASLAEAYARIEGREVWLINFHISSYKYGHCQNHEPMRMRKLLLHAREIRKLKPNGIYGRYAVLLNLALADSTMGQDRRNEMR